MKQNILIVEDEPQIQDLIRHGLEREGFFVSAYQSGEQALYAVENMRFDLALLDVMLPGIDGIELCRRLKADPATEPMAVIFLSAKSEDADIADGLEMGAVNYITKPFSLKSLISMIRATLRLSSKPLPNINEMIQLNGFALHLGKHELKVNGERVDLTRTEFSILTLMMKNPGWAYSRSQIINSIHNAGKVVNGRAIDVQILNLRRKLGAAGRHIETVRGIGYRMVLDD